MFVGDLLDSGQTLAPPLTAFEKDGLKVVFGFEGPREGNMVPISVTASNQSGATMNEFLFQAAVPRVSWCQNIGAATSLCLADFPDSNAVALRNRPAA